MCFAEIIETVKFNKDQVLQICVVNATSHAIRLVISHVTWLCVRYAAFQLMRR